MDNNKVLLYFGALLHDIGKIVYRGMSASGTHSKLGADFIKNEVSPQNDDFSLVDGLKIIEQIRYHHAKEINASKSLQEDSLAYITYFADNISAGMDRKNEGDEEDKAFFDKSVKLHKIFNILNGHSDKNTIEHEEYNALREQLKHELINLKISQSELNSLLNILDKATSSVPSSTNLSELIDVSLYDHSKTTAGIAACIYDYFLENNITNYKEALFSKDKSARYYSERMFLLASCDMSGIQDFIYNISGSGALKQLRARSLYLDLMMEHIVDELMERLNLCRANVLYTGGGHAYMLLPNTDAVKQTIDAFYNELKEWFIREYKTDLYVAHAFIECSAHDLSNEGDDKQRFSNLFKELSSKLSESKAARYTAQDIQLMNSGASNPESERECRECHKSSKLESTQDGTDICNICNSLHKISSGLVKKDVFAVVDCGTMTQSNAPHLLLPFDRELYLYTKGQYNNEKPQIIRVYTKNSWDAGVDLATHIWMGDYTAETEDGISDYAKTGKTLEDNFGINRLGVLRADVDNLGTAFSSGLPAEKASISRTATLSRALSYFFKKKINDILRKNEYKLQIIYSGGDDLFIVGNWSDVLYAAIDIRKALKEFTGNDSLSISAGIGMFNAKYPIARMAFETGELEDAAKLYEKKLEDGTVVSKNAVAIWSSNAVFSWDEFSEIIEPRMYEIAQVFEDNDKGKAFIYKIVSLLRNFDDVISLPRLAYLLARSFEKKNDCNQLCQKFYNWALDENERKYLITAIEWYVYSIREG